MSEPVEIRRNPDQSIDEICIDGGNVHIEQMDGNSWFMGVEARDGSYWQFWFGAKNRKSLVEFRHTEMTPARAALDKDTGKSKQEPPPPPDVCGVTVHGGFSLHPFAWLKNLFTRAAIDKDAEQ